MAVIGVSKIVRRRDVKKHITDWIAAEKLSQGDRVLSQNEFARLLNTTQLTVYRAMDELVKEKVIHRRFGSGTFVGTADVGDRLKTVCFVLPGEHLDDPDYNPIYWPYVQSLLKAFIEASGTEWSFGTRVFVPGTPLTEQVVNGFAPYDLVVFHYSKEPKDLLACLVGKRIVPVACFGLPVAGIDCLTVDHDIAHGSRDAIQYLSDRGGRRIALVTSPQQWSEPWIHGYKAGLVDCGLVFDPSLVVRVGESILDGESAAASLVDDKIKFDAVFAETDIKGAGVVEGLRKRGMKVPGDVAVMSYGGLDHFTGHHPYLASVKIAYREMIRTMLGEASDLGRKSFPKKHISVPCDIKKGRTA